MNQSHAQQVLDIEEMMAGLVAPGPKAPLTDENFADILLTCNSTPDQAVGAIMQIFGFGDWFTRLGHIAVSAAIKDWPHLTTYERMHRLRWFSVQVEKWPR